MQTVNENQKNSLEIPITSPSSPLVPLQIHEFVKDVNIPIETKVNTNTPIITGGSGSGSDTNTGFLGYFKSFFQRFSQQKKQDVQDNSSFQKLFYSGDGIDKPKEEEETKPKEEETKEEEEIDDEVEITKIILITKEDPEIVLRESLKGTKLYYFMERTESDLPSQWV
jgi:hypothetical protein